MLGQIAHIRARTKGGPRYDPMQTVDENRSPDNLLAVCHEHGNLIDEDENLEIYTIERLQEMKAAHEAKIERRADRSWIKYPNHTVSHVVLGVRSTKREAVYWWVDRHGDPQVYTDRQLEVAQILQQLYSDLSALCLLQEVVSDNPDASGRSLLQSYATMKIKDINPENGKPWSPIEHILRTIAKVPDITFGEFTKSLLVEGSDGTKLFVAMERELKSKPDED